MNYRSLGTSDPHKRSHKDTRAVSVRGLMQWHFSARTGSPYWVTSRASLPFDPLEDVQTTEQLEIFGDWAKESKGTDCLSLIPTGLPHSERVVRPGYQSAGLPLLERWFDLLMDWRVSGYSKPPAFDGESTLIALAPRCQFAISVSAERARRLGTRPYVIAGDGVTFREFCVGSGDESERRCSSAMSHAKVRYISTSPVHLLLLLEDPSFTPILTRSVRHIAIYIDGENEDLALEALRAVPEHVEVSFVISVPEAVAEFRTGLVGREDSTFKFNGFGPHISVTFGEPECGPGGRGEQPPDLRVTHLSRWGFLPGVKVSVGRVAHLLGGAATTDFEVHFH